MANMSLNVNMENLTEEERNQLIALVKKSTEEKPKVWKPRDGEKYYYIKTNYPLLTIGSVNWGYNGCFDNLLYEIGNCYRTREETVFALEKLKVIAELKRFAQEHNEKIDWNNEDQRKYHLYYSYFSDSILISFAYYKKLNVISFTSGEIAQQAIKTIGADRLKKYYFEVED